MTKPTLIIAILLTCCGGLADGGEAATCQPLTAPLVVPPHSCAVIRNPPCAFRYGTHADDAAPGCLAIETGEWPLYLAGDADVDVYPDTVGCSCGISSLPPLRLGIDKGEGHLWLSSSFEAFG